MSHHQLYLLARRQSLQQIAGQLVAEDARLTQTALQSLLVLLTGVRSAPRSLQHTVNDAHHIPAQTALQPRRQRVVLQLHLHQNTRHTSPEDRASISLSVCV